MTGASVPEGSWYVLFVIDRDDHGWRSLEFLAWFVRDTWRTGQEIALEARAFPPWLNTPGEMLTFDVHSSTEDPAEFAKWLDKTRRTYYIAPGQEEE